ncbi:MAG: hypothetical protein RLZZ211_549 [Bacteroidota bacterium]|jgi:hypothetical protein
MKTLIFSLFLGFAGTALTQITLQVNDFATADDTVRMSLANPITIDLQNTGANAVWDFSQLSAQSQSLINYNPIGFGSLLIIASYGPFASTPYKATYFNLTNDLPLDQFSAFLPIELSNLSQYTRRTSSQINSIGYSIDVQGQGLPFKSDTIETRYELPLNFNDTYTSRGYTYIDLNPATDIKFIQHRERTSIVDGWGTLSTPLGTFQALRIRHDITENDSIYQTFFGAGTWIAPPSFVTTEYEWWTTGKKEFLVKATVGGFGQNGGAATIEYQDIYLGLDAGIDEVNFTFDFYPNPAAEWCFFKSSIPFDVIELIDLNGKVVAAHQNAALNGYFDISELQTGTYTMRIHSSNGVLHKKLVKL